MDKVISLLYDIENEANAILSKANEQKKDLKIKYDASIQELNQSMDSKMALELEKFNKNTTMS